MGLCFCGNHDRSGPAQRDGDVEMKKHRYPLVETWSVSLLTPISWCCVETKGNPFDGFQFGSPMWNGFVLMAAQIENRLSERRYLVKLIGGKIVEPGGSF